MRFHYSVQNVGGGSLQDGEFEASSFSDARIEALKAVEPTFDPSFLKTARWHAWQAINKNSQCRYLYSDTRKRFTHCLRLKTEERR